MKDPDAKDAHDLVDAGRLDPRRAPLWTPVCLGVGVQAYFLWPTEPNAFMLGLAAAALIGGALAARARLGATAAFAAAGVALVVLGIALAAWRVQGLAAPVLDRERTGVVVGVAIHIDRSSSSGVKRVMLADPQFAGAPELNGLRRVRVSLGRRSDFAFEIGDTVELHAKLRPPGGSIYPGGFDFRLWAWSRQLAAVGYAIKPGYVTKTYETTAPWPVRLARLRAAVADDLAARLGSKVGAFAAAIAVGSRAHADKELLEDLRKSSLAHLLAISGLHMGLLTGVIFFVVRGFGALTPGVSARVPMKKIAALCALSAGFAYLTLSGAAIATCRAYLMATFLLCAILLDRPAATMRALSAAATVILLIWPEELLSAGFQMSFAAALALVAVYERAGAAVRAPFDAGVWTKTQLWVAGALLTSVVAGGATTPFSLAHFNQASSYGVAANMVAGPIMAFWVMPCLALAGALAPFDLEGPALAVMGMGIEHILTIATWAADQPGSVWRAPQPHAAALPLVCAGGLWLCLAGRRRLWGVLPILIAAAVWRVGTPPDVLIAPGAQILGLRAPDGALGVTRESRGSYAAKAWLRAEGAPPDQAAAFALADWRCGGGMCYGAARGRRLTLAYRDDAQDVEALCVEADIVIAPRIHTEAPAPESCLILDASDVGDQAVGLRFNGPHIEILKPRADPRVWLRQ